MWRLGEDGRDAGLEHQPLPAVGSGVAVQAGLGHRASSTWDTLLPLSPPPFSVDELACLSSSRWPSRNLCMWVP